MCWEHIKSVWNTKRGRKVAYTPGVKLEPRVDCNSFVVVERFDQNWVAFHVWNTGVGSKVLESNGSFPLLSIIGTMRIKMVTIGNELTRSAAIRYESWVPFCVPEPVSLG
jgi:hypothetical protein